MFVYLCSSIIFSLLVIGRLSTVSLPASIIAAIVYTGVGAPCVWRLLSWLKSSTTCYERFITGVLSFESACLLYQYLTDSRAFARILNPVFYPIFEWTVIVIVVLTCVNCVYLVRRKVRRQ